MSVANVTLGLRNSLTILHYGERELLSRGRESCCGAVVWEHELEFNKRSRPVAWLRPLHE